MSEFGEPWEESIAVDGHDNEILNIIDDCGCVVAYAYSDDGTGQSQIRRAKFCVNALAGLSEEQIQSINWSKVPALVESVRNLDPSDEDFRQLYAAFEAVEGK